MYQMATDSNHQNLPSASTSDSSDESDTRQQDSEAPQSVYRLMSGETSNFKAAFASCNVSYQKPCRVHVDCDCAPIAD